MNEDDWYDSGPDPTGCARAVIMGLLLEALIGFTLWRLF